MVAVYYGLSSMKKHRCMASLEEVHMLPDSTCRLLVKLETA